MPDTDHEYKGISIVINTKALTVGSWSAVFTLHEDNPCTVTPFDIPILGASHADVERKALAEAHREIDKVLFGREIVSQETERQVRR